MELCHGNRNVCASLETQFAKLKSSNSVLPALHESPLALGIEHISLGHLVNEAQRSIPKDRNLSQRCQLDINHSKESKLASLSTDFGGIMSFVFLLQLLYVLWERTTINRP